MKSLRVLAALRVLVTQPRAAVVRLSAALYPVLRRGVCDYVLAVMLSGSCRVTCYDACLLLMQVYGQRSWSLIEGLCDLPVRDLLRLRGDGFALARYPFGSDVLSSALHRGDLARVHVLCRLGVRDTDLLVRALWATCQRLREHAYRTMWRGGVWHQRNVDHALVMIRVLLSNIGNADVYALNSALYALWDTDALLQAKHAGVNALDGASQLVERAMAPHLPRRLGPVDLPKHVIVRMHARARDAAWQRAVECRPPLNLHLLAIWAPIARPRHRRDHVPCLHAPLLHAQPGAPYRRAICNGPAADATATSRRSEACT